MAINFVFSSSAFTVSANPLVVGAIGAEIYGWCAVASAGGTQINYSQKDFLQFGHIDVNGKLVIDDIAGARTKIQNDYSALAQQTQESTEDVLKQQIKDYNYALDCAELNSEGMTFSDYYKQSLDAANAKYDSSVSLIDTRLANGEITQAEATMAKSKLWSDYNVANNALSSMYKSLSTWIGENKGREQLSVLELSYAQLKAFTDFMNSSGGFSNGKMTVKNGVQGSIDDLSLIKIPAQMEMYFAPIVTEKFSSVYFGNNVKSFYYSKVCIVGSLIKYQIYDGLTNKLCVDNILGDVIQDISGNGTYVYKFNYYTINSSEFGQGVTISYDIYNKDKIVGNRTIVQKNHLTIATSNILSPSKPVFNDNSVALPAYTVPVSKTTPLTTTMPVDTPDDTPIAVPLPVVDVDTGVIDNTIPIEVDVPRVDIDSDLPDLSLPTMISNKFPFCLPFDLYRAVKLLVAEPVVPHWDVNLKIPISEAVGGGNLDFSFSIDFSQFELIGRLCRWFSTILFTFSLVKVTPLICKGAGS